MRQSLKENLKSLGWNKLNHFYVSEKSTVTKSLLFKANKFTSQTLVWLLKCREMLIRCLKNFRKGCKKLQTESKDKNSAKEKSKGIAQPTSIFIKYI